MKKFFILSFCLATLFPAFVSAQEEGKIYNHFDEYRRNNLQEKLFVHTDRDFYLCGEIMWFRLYYVDGADHKPLNISKVAYVEVLDTAENSVLQAKIALKDGFGEGSFFIPTTISSGKYVLRAYTNWMKNYGADFYFHKEISIVNSFKNLNMASTQTHGKPDVQFFPEGGRLVEGLKSKVAFKGVASNGRSFNFDGAVVSDNGDTVVSFSPQKFGMGYFYFTPESSRSYRAVVKDEENKRYEYELPEVSHAGYILSLTDQGDDVAIEVTANGVIAQNLQFFAQCRQQIVKMETKAFDGKKIKFTLQKSELKDGINHFTIFDQLGNPLCERLYFKYPDNKIDFSSETANARFSTRQKVALNIKAADDNQQPLSADLSVSVYRLDSLNKPQRTNILSYLLLTSDLKGEIESPDFYFKDDVPEMDVYLDNLMLTHGWRRFAWKDVLSSNSWSHKYIPEYRTHIVRAKVIDKQSGMGVQGLQTFLSLPAKYVVLGADKSDANGMLAYEFDNFFGPGDIYLQTPDEKDSLYLFEAISPFSSEYSGFKRGELDISPSLGKALLSRSINMQTRNVYLSNELNRFSPPADTTSFYLTPDKTYFLDDYTRFTIMEDVMREYVPEIWVRIKDGSFHFRTLDIQRNEMFHDNPMVFYDGIPVFDIDKIMNVDPLKIRKMEILTRKYFFGDVTFDGILSYTSYKGNLDGIKLEPSVNIIQYDGLQLEREFYQPKYEKSSAGGGRIPDFRNLLYWNPSVKTDKKGNTIVEFFTSELPGTYLITINGMTKNGLSGSGEFTIAVEQQVN